MKFRTFRYRNFVAVTEDRKSASEVRKERREAGLAGSGMKGKYDYFGEGIYLPLPNELTNAYNAEWEMSDSMLTAGVADALSANGADVFKEAGKTLAASVAGGIMSKFTGQHANPRKMATFKGMQNRTFEWTFTMAPKSDAESRAITTIVKRFITAATPVADSASDTFFGFPAEFQVSFHNVGDLFPKLKNLVCTNVTHNLSPQGMQLLRDGNPVETSLSLSFMESDPIYNKSPGI